MLTLDNIRIHHLDCLNRYPNLTLIIDMFVSHGVGEANNEVRLDSERLISVELQVAQGLKMKDTQEPRVGK